MRLQLPPRDSEGNDKEPSLGQICLAGAGSGMVGSYVQLSPHAANLQITDMSNGAGQG